MNEVWVANSQYDEIRLCGAVLRVLAIMVAFAPCTLSRRLFAQLLYGTGMRINEGLQLHLKDIDFGRGTIIVREGKDGKDRALMLPQRLAPGLREQLARARVLWQADQAAGRGGVAMPDALDRKDPCAGAS